MHSVTNAAVVRLTYRPPTGHGRLVSNQHQNIMKKTIYALASSAAVVALLAATPALADSDRGLRFGDDHDIGIGAVVRLLAKDGGHDGIGATVRELAREQRDRDNRGENGRDEHATSTVAIRGTIAAISGSDITVSGSNGTTYTVHAANATLSGNGGAIVFGDLMVGDTVVVRGTLDGTVLTAVSIRDISLAQRSFLSLIGAAGAGVVTSVTGSTFTIDPIGAQSTTTVTTNASTTYLLNGQATTSNALNVGSKVFVSGTTTSATSITAAIVSIWNSGISFLRHLIFLQ